MNEQKQNTYRINTHSSEKVGAVFEAIRRINGFEFQTEVVEHLCSYFDGLKPNFDSVLNDCNIAIQKSEHIIKQEELKIKQIKDLIEKTEYRKKRQEEAEVKAQEPQITELRRTLREQIEKCRDKEPKEFINEIHLKLDLPKELVQKEYEPLKKLINPDNKSYAQLQSEDHERRYKPLNNKL